MSQNIYDLHIIRSEILFSFQPRKKFWDPLTQIHKTADISKFVGGNEILTKNSKSA